MSKSKQVTSQIKLTIGAGEAKPAPPVGPALGARGVNIMEFCKVFNDKTSSLDKGAPVPVVIDVYSDRSFSFVMKTPPASYLLKQAAGLKSGSSNPGKGAFAGSVTNDQVNEIAKQKMVDLNANDLEQAKRIIEGTARACGIRVVD